jgi:hypothetical protein
MLSAAALYEMVGLAPTGTTVWGEDIPSNCSGVYVICCENASLVRFIEHPQAERECGLWNADQNIIYIGKARCLRQRLHQFCRHRYGNHAPHRGGQSLLLLDCKKIIIWAEVANDYGLAEAKLIQSFESTAGHLPFANRSRPRLLQKSR